MAEYRPYRMVDEAARWQLHRLVVFTAFVALSLLINWFITERVAQLLSFSPSLGGRMSFGLYDPWDWAIWWYRWRDAQDLQLLWDSCLHTGAYGMVAVAAATGLALVIGRMWIMRKEVPDLHGSAHWANTADVAAAGFLWRKPLLPAGLRKPLVRFGLARGRVRQHGIYLGAWGRGGKRHLLRDCGPGHVLIEAPTRAGKGVNSIIPTLLTWQHSALIFDLKGENWELTAGARSAMGQLCLKFDPTDHRHHGQVQPAGTGAPAYRIRSRGRAEHRAYDRRSRWRGLERSLGQNRCRITHRDHPSSAVCRAQ